MEIIILIATICAAAISIFGLFIYGRGKFLIELDINGEKTSQTITQQNITISLEKEKIYIRLRDTDNKWEFKKSEKENYVILEDQKSIQGDGYSITIKPKQLSNGLIYGGIAFYEIIVVIIMLIMMKGNIANNEESVKNTTEASSEIESQNNESVNNKSVANSVEEKSDADDLAREQATTDTSADAVDYSSFNLQNIDWNKYITGDDGFRHIKNDDLETECGISVSYYQGDIDWAKVYNAGIDYAMIRVGYQTTDSGNIYQDKRFESYMQNALNNNIKVGMYFYSQATNEEEMDENIDFILKYAKEYKLDYPIGLNLDRGEEDAASKEKLRTRNLNDNEYVALIKQFCDKISAQGYVPIIYTTENSLSKIPSKKIGEYPLWIYGSKSKLSYSQNCVIWQYRNYFRVDGIPKKVSVSFSIVPFCDK